MRILDSLARATRRLLRLAVLISACGAAAAGDLAVTNVDLIPAPGAARVPDATILIRGGRIAEVGTGLETAGLPVIDGGGRVASAGFWNSHVHLTDPALVEDPQPVLRDMLLSYGFTSVVDTGSFLEDSLRLVAAIESGRLDGPRVWLANGSFVHTGGTPAYLPGITLPELAAPAEAKPAVDAYLDAGAQGIKLFSGSFMSPTETILMRPAVIRAVADAAHARGSFVMAHPTDRDGLVNAVENGVDVVVHTAPPAGPLGDGLVRSMLARDVALIPTLKLWRWELARAGVPEDGIRAFEAAGVAQLGEYHRAGGEVLFGTDVGYMRDYDTAAELRLMARAGMDWIAIHHALTRNPARRFAGESGAVEPGAPGDLVLLGSDPAVDVAAFADVVMTIRGGRVVHERAR
ncbi:MAG: amidohydrolase family protein [Pseudomonadales bacterium]